MHKLDLHVEGVNILFSNQFEISGPPETWIHVFLFFFLLKKKKKKPPRLLQLSKKRCFAVKPQKCFVDLRNFLQPLIRPGESR